MKLAVATDWGDKKSAFFWNKDGFLRMLQVLRDRDGWEVMFFRKHPEQTFTWEHDCVKANISPDPAKALLAWKPDAILFFCDFSRPILGELENCGIPMAQCYTGGRFTTYENVADIVFVESKSYVDWMKMRGIRGKVVQAFGTNTDLFKPYAQPKFFDAIFPATFASWKRHKLFCEAMGERGLVFGWWQEKEIEIIADVFKFKGGILHHQMAESCALMYSMARTVVITSNDHGGSQRTVLEALACNIPTIVMADSTMTSEYIRECGEGAIVEPTPEAIRKAVDEWKDKKTNTREWVMKNYSEYIYADKVRDGILSICQKSVS